MNKYGKLIENIILIGMLAVGLGLVVIEQFATESTDYKGLVPYISAVSSTLLTSGLLGLLYKKYVDGQHYGEIKRLLRIHESIEDSSLIRYIPRASNYNYNDLINNTKKLTVVLNDGNHWVTSNGDDLLARFSRKSTTELFVLSRESPFIDALVNKVDHYTKEQYLSKLDTAKHELVKLYEESCQKGELKIYELKNYPTQSYYLTETLIVTTPYQICSKRLNIPAYEYDATRKNSHFVKYVYKDVAYLRKESVLYFDSEKK
ncbi:TPA: hypothetical protein ACVO0I_004608 [Vibrio diabolicus]